IAQKTAQGQDAPILVSAVNFLVGYPEPALIQIEVFQETRKIFHRTCPGEQQQDMPEPDVVMVIGSDEIIFMHGLDALSIEIGKDTGDRSGSGGFETAEILRVLLNMEQFSQISRQLFYRFQILRLQAIDRV